MKKILVTVIAVLGIGVGYYFYSSRSENRGIVLAASFDCKDGFPFMAEFPDENSVMITYNTGVKNKTFVGTLPRTEGPGKRFENKDIAYIFAGEEATVITKSNNKTVSCNQPFDTNNAPVNFGDAGEGAGAHQDISGAVNSDIIGKWQSVDDTKFTRTFNTDGTIVDSYGNTPDTGTWKTFTKNTAPKDISYPLETNVSYIRIISPSKGEPVTLDFQVGELTPESLQLIYMSRGNMLNFTKIK